MRLLRDSTMRAALRLVLVVILAIPAVAYWPAGSTATSTPHAPRSTSHAAIASPPWLGSGSCASMGCHNANGLKGDPGSEYTTWISYDLHARAYEALFKPKSKSIIKNLRLADNKPAHELPLCLNCHVHRDYDPADHLSRFAKEDGVGCESCHGPASAWVSEHYKPAWRNLPDGEKAARGMWDTRSLIGRTQSCTPCHVGAPGMDVNHDLIAAGHPRLAFEFTAYHALMPHHWRDTQDKKPGASPHARPDWDTAAWFVGQAAATQADLLLLAARTRSNAWPEFAEFDCYACHHQIANQSWRQERGFANRKPGSLPWNDWYVNLLPYTVYPGDGKANEVLAELKKTRELIEANTGQDPEAIRQQADKAAKAVATWIKRFDSTRYLPQDSSKILKQLVQSGATQKAGSWDEAAQTYLAVAALYHARPTDASQLPGVQEALKKVRALLQFTPNSDSPPLGYTPDLLLQPYGGLRERLGGLR